MKKLIFVLTVSALVLSFGAPVAQASPFMLKVEFGADLASLSTYAIVDDQDFDGLDNDDDASPTLGVIQYFAFLGDPGDPMGLDMSITTGNSSPPLALLPGELARLDLSTMQVHNNLAAPAAARLTLVNTYTGAPPSGPVSANGAATLSLDSLTNDSSIQLQTWVAPILPGFPPPTPPNALALYTDTAYGPGLWTPTGSAAFDLSDYSGGFSLITQVTVLFTSTGSASATDDTVSVTPRAVPEPASLFLIGSGVLGLGAVIHRRNRKRNRSTVPVVA